MSGIEVDPEWIRRYGKTVQTGSTDLGKTAQSLAQPLRNEAFGELGRQVGTAEAYSKAASALRDQLRRAVEALGTAAVELDKVAAQYGDDDERAAKKMNRVETRR
ncbi:hypothetical protein EV193_106375 [Herbihabitans rhizosphaerae]|uniref:Excreted virulence factor EspC (Type VII ESX diderm) n=1 Tax=Herbihabitans rhizosphaerae TaxID=1872711 RepID=A0A4Q7KLK2_9PSEU|nr:hypothetical protein [Herbihabitans rhizosphaerae]RZS37137.1 hypothetical protein EV193_106375 [Herbihabitans rhizosphaerae]